MKTLHRNLYVTLYHFKNYKNFTLNDKEEEGKYQSFFNISGNIKI